MDQEADPAALVGRRPDARLLDEDLSALPVAVGQPRPLPVTRRRARVVAIGATLTGVTLLLGLALLVLGGVEALTDGLATGAAIAMALGAVLIATHWGWVHLAEYAAQSLEQRHRQHWVQGQQRWLDAVEPYPQLSVTTEVGEDGSIAIVTLRHRPVPLGERGFTFVREVAGREVHPAEEPAALVSERAELLRRNAAAETAAERERYEAARDAYERAALADEDEQQRLAAARAASEALADRINSNLREPPLAE